MKGQRSKYQVSILISSCVYEQNQIILASWTHKPSTRHYGLLISLFLINYIFRVMYHLRYSEVKLEKAA